MFERGRAAPWQRAAGCAAHHRAPLSSPAAPQLCVLLAGPRGAELSDPSLSSSCFPDTLRLHHHLSRVSVDAHSPALTLPGASSLEGAAPSAHFTPGCGRELLHTALPRSHHWGRAHGTQTGLLAVVLCAARPRVALGLFEGWLKWHWEQMSSAKDLCYFTSHQCLLACRFELQCVHHMALGGTRKPMKGRQKKAARDKDGNVTASTLPC